MATARRKSKRKAPAKKKRPVKRVVNVITKSKVKKDDIVEIKFKPMEFKEDGSPKHIPIEQGYAAKERLNLQSNLKFLLQGGRCEVIAESRRGDSIKIRAPGVGFAHEGWIVADVIETITLVDKVRRISPKTLSYEIVFRGETMNVDCQNVSRTDVEKIFVVMADWLGYEIS